MKTVTCKVPERLDAELEAVARDEGVSKSAIIRETLEDRFARKPSKKKPHSMHARRSLPSGTS